MLSVGLSTRYVSYFMIDLLCMIAQLYSCLTNIVLFSFSYLFAFFSHSIMLQKRVFVETSASSDQQQFTSQVGWPGWFRPPSRHTFHRSDARNAWLRSRRQSPRLQNDDLPGRTTFTSSIGSRHGNVTTRKTCFNVRVLIRIGPVPCVWSDSTTVRCLMRGGGLTWRKL